ncbi:unnamed protein product, partial [Linum tenue]
FLPAGMARTNRLVLVAFQQVVKESFALYIEKPKMSHKIIQKWISGVVETTIMDAETTMVDTHLIDSLDFLSWDMGDTLKDFTVRERSGQG